MVEKLTFNSWATALVDIPAVSMPIECDLKNCDLKNCDLSGFVPCDKTAHFRVAFYCGQPKVSAIIMLSNQYLDMPHL